MALDLIHCLGDSHVSLFTGRHRAPRIWPKRSIDLLPNFRTFRLGAPLAYNLPESGTTSQGRERLFEILSRPDCVAPGSYVLLCFGEIDCRAHLLRQAAAQHRPVADLAAECARRYLGVAAEVAALGFRVLIYNAIASTPREFSDFEFPTHGTCRERNAATALFNQALREGCASAGYGFLETFDLLVDADGATRKSLYCCDQIHLSQRALAPTLERLRLLLPDIAFEKPLRCRVLRLFWDIVKR